MASLQVCCSRCCPRVASNLLLQGIFYQTCSSRGLSSNSAVAAVAAELLQIYRCRGKPSPNILGSIPKLPSNLPHTSFKPALNIVQTSSKHPSKPSQTSFEPAPNTLQTSLKHPSRDSQTSLKPAPNILQRPLLLLCLWSVSVLALFCFYSGRFGQEQPCVHQVWLRAAVHSRLG